MDDKNGLMLISDWQTLAQVCLTAAEYLIMRQIEGVAERDDVDNKLIESLDQLQIKLNQVTGATKVYIYND